MRKGKMSDIDGYAYDQDPPAFTFHWIKRQQEGEDEAPKDIGRGYYDYLKKISIEADISVQGWMIRAIHCNSASTLNVKGIGVFQKESFGAESGGTVIMLSDVSRQRARQSVLHKRINQKIEMIKTDLLNSRGLTEKEINVAISLGLIDRDGAYFWTEEWQKGEREAERDIIAGRVSGPMTVQEMKEYFDERSNMD